MPSRGNEVGAASWVILPREDHADTIGSDETAEASDLLLCRRRTAGRRSFDAAAAITIAMRNFGPPIRHSGDSPAHHAVRGPDSPSAPQHDSALPRAEDHGAKYSRPGRWRSVTPGIHAPSPVPPRSAPAMPASVPGGPNRSARAGRCPGRRRKSAVRPAPGTAIGAMTSAPTPGDYSKGAMGSRRQPATVIGCSAPRRRAMLKIRWCFRSPIAERSFPHRITLLH
jgi:hypothetical protein